MLFSATAPRPTHSLPFSDFSLLSFAQLKRGQRRLFLKLPFRLVLAQEYFFVQENPFHHRGPQSSPKRLLSQRAKGRNAESMLDQTGHFIPNLRAGSQSHWSPPHQRTAHRLMITPLSLQVLRATAATPSRSWSRTTVDSLSSEAQISCVDFSESTWFMSRKQRCGLSSLLMSTRGTSHRRQCAAWADLWRGSAAGV